MDPHSDPVAFVTGASSGLGRALSLALARDGYAVGIFARRRTLLESLAAEILDAGGRVSVHVGDVGERTSVRRAVHALESEFGAVDLLIANAGIGGDRKRGEVDAQDFETVMRVNLLGAVYAVEAVLPGMRKRRSGHLVSVSSLAGYGGLPGAAAYSASKAAMTQYFEALRIELRGSGVDVTVLMPGYIRTPMTEASDHARPFLLELDQGTRRMLGAIRRRKRAYAFPWPMAMAVRLGRLLPRGLYDWLLGSRRL
jgi:short-subunit dehydrogenase